MIICSKKKCFVKFVNFVAYKESKANDIYKSDE